MKEAYAVRRTVPPSAEIQAEIDKLLVGAWSMTRRRCCPSSRGSVLG